MQPVRLGLLALDKWTWLVGVTSEATDHAISPFKLVERGRAARSAARSDRSGRLRIQLASMDAIKKNTPRFPLLLSVDQVLKWALIAAGWMAVTLGIGSAVFVAIIRILSGKLTWTILGADLVSLWDWNDGLGYLWLSVPQAAAAAVGLLLLHRRRARSGWCLALVAVVSATVAHYMNARVVHDSIAANPRGIAYTILAGGGNVITLGADLLGLISLLIGGPEY
ncbi:hypothetical protein EJB05_55031, partial [Eragrostis curvula]